MMRIRELRKARGLTQGELAERVGLSRSYLAEIESGAKPVNNLRLGRLAEELGVTEADLYPSHDSAPMRKFLRLPPDDRAEVERLIEHFHSKLPPADGQ